MTFEELGLEDRILKAISELGFERPMSVQEAVIPVLLNEKKDVVVLAQTGTGKTAAFGLPLLQKISAASDINDTKTQALVLCPTRELCLQISEDLNDYSKYLDGIRILPVYGGSSIRSQIDMLHKGAHIIVATPGRLLDLMNRGHVNLKNVHSVVMDEADEMLNMGFVEDIDTILSEVPQERNILLFSATMPSEVEKIARKYMKDPSEIVIGRKNESTASVRHICYMVQAKDKYQTLKRVIDYCPRIYAIIFCRTKVETQEIADKLIHDGYNADSLHGDLSQAQRDYVMQRFRIRNLRLLVATDVAARGLDVDDLTHVINYTLPDEVETYTHRSGRTGRAGKTGVSIAILNLREKKRIAQIERSIGKKFEEGRIPTGKEICSKQIFSLIDRIENAEVDEDEIAEVLPSVYRKLEWLDKEELIKRLVSQEFNRIIGYYKENDDFETVSSSGRKVDVTRTEGFTKLFVNLGKMDGVSPKSLLGTINDCVKGKVGVGRIDIFTRYTLLDVAEDAAADVIRELSTLKLKGRAIRADIATDEQIERGKKPEKKPFKKDNAYKSQRKGGRR